MVGPQLQGKFLLGLDALHGPDLAVRLHYLYGLYYAEAYRAAAHDQNLFALLGPGTQHGMYGYAGGLNHYGLFIGYFVIYLC